MSTRRGFQYLYAPVILTDSIYRKKNEHCYPKLFSEKYFIQDIEIYCSNSDEEYYDEECFRSGFPFPEL